MKIRYLLDENLDPDLIVALQKLNKQIDILRVGHEGAPPLGTKDPQILRHLMTSQRLLVTENRKSMPHHLNEHFIGGANIGAFFGFVKGRQWGRLLKNCTYDGKLVKLRNGLMLRIGFRKYCPIEKMIKQLAHVCIKATDLAATEQFYCGLLGMEKRFRFDKEGTIIGFYLGLGGRTFIEVFADEGAGNAVGKRPLIDHLCLEVDNIDATIDRVRAQGHGITDKKFGCDNTWQAWLSDPSGVRIELFEYTENSSQFSGVDCVVDW